MQTPPARVRVVVLNYDGGAMTLDCLDSVLASEWPAEALEVVLVDNGSLDGIAEVVRTDERYRHVILLEPLANLGFAGGCNLGISHPGDHTHLLLLNNDATIARDAIGHLVAASSDPRTGAVAAKILFADPAQGVRLECDEATRLAPGDPRRLGVRVSGVRLDSDRVDERIGFDEGFYGPEVPVAADDEELARWSRKAGAVRVRMRPGDDPVRVVSLRLSCLSERQVTVRDELGGTGERTVTVGPEPIWVDVEVDPRPFDVINNVGSELYRQGFAGDRGFLEADRHQYDEPAEVFAWCGGAVLLRRDYLDQVGVFDERMFLYYEDTELSLRGRRRGWSYRYEPHAVVRHRHGASTGVGSDTFRYYTERNRLLVTARHGRASVAARIGLGELRRGVAAQIRSYVLNPLRLRMPRRAEAAFRRRVLRGYLTLLPAMLAARRDPDAVVSRRAISAWERDKWGEGS
jgi:GT2 family glycosyltransferase